jgi:hypothetical protein
MLKLVGFGKFADLPGEQISEKISRRVWGRTPGWSKWSFPLPVTLDPSLSPLPVRLEGRINLAAAELNTTRAHL